MNIKNAILAAALMLSACDIDTTPYVTYGPELEETAVVEDVIYSPEQNGTATGFTFGGDFHVSSVHTNAKYVVVFRCQHGKFIIDSQNNELAEHFWKLAVKGQTVTLKYREVFHAKQLYKWETLKLTPPAEKT